ncbi:putative choline kinase [Candidatus Mycoplasma haematolamae str. Purdue]|uniref:Putative choline kinase n=1 Tax=Mycoplasma haematolamae (strain Purdue) TaxID=1212765 RepID=I7C658_MYCHA|nr:phosphotransferase [Candidatus Mycoplasma haematolamae]AFO51967.1 putative choline kinase [Candidatus Mycoplasma haematolamae str. Purdue]
MSKEIARNYFLAHFPQYRAEIRSFRKVIVGFSNQIFKITLLDGRSFKVRLAENNDLISRENEQEVLKLVEDPFLLAYDSSTGNAIYKWIEGEPLRPKVIDRGVLERIIQLARRYHSVPENKLTNILPHDDFDSSDKVDFDRREYNDYFPIYKELVEKYKDLPKVLTHNDISLKNLIYSRLDSGELGLFLIDYEWARVNTIYWEYGNFARESQLSKNNIKLLADLLHINADILIDFTFIATFYSWQLSFNWDRTDRLEQYRNKLVVQLKRYKGWRKPVTVAI